MSESVPRILVAGTHSGVGKTTLAVGILAELRRRGLQVQPFKVGPDYIDPTYHSLAAGRAARNLDAWMVPPQRIPGLFLQAARGADLALVEGVMGLYDGFGYQEERGSTGEMAKLLAAPTVLVVDAQAMARSAGALVLGYQAFDPDLPLAGVIVNRVGSEGHGQGVAQAIRDTTGLPVLGWLPRTDGLDVPERHLGLVPTQEMGRAREFVDAARAHVERHVDLDGLLALARRAPPLDPPAPLPRVQRVAGPEAPVLAVAQDPAFSFTYPENLALLEAAGARIEPFSPLRDPDLPPGTAGVILSGGFPELHARELARNRAMHGALRRAHGQGLPIYAECGGLMYLTQAIVDLDGERHPMVGLLPGHSAMAGRLTLGYREVEALADSWLWRRGERTRGHEFHYSRWEGRPPSLSPAYRLLPTRPTASPQLEGACLGSLWASYVHLHLWARPELAERFVAAAVRARGRTP